MTDTEALDLIAATLSGEPWSPDTLDAIAAAVRATGRTVADVADAAPWPTCCAAPVKVLPPGSADAMCGNCAAEWPPDAPLLQSDADGID